MIPTFPETDTINNNLSQLNFCLDDNYIEVNEETAFFLRVKMFIKEEDSTEEVETENLFALKKGCFKFNPGEYIQRFMDLKEDQINSYFDNYQLDVAPHHVKMYFEFLSASYGQMFIYEMAYIKFHKGKSSAIHGDDYEVVRSLSYNSILPLVYRYSENPVLFKFKDKVLSFDKTTPSAPDHIFQMMFFQKYHFADATKLPVGFSTGFSSGFATADAIIKSESIYRYDEGFINTIESDYTIKGVNFPIQTNSINVIWLDESDYFNGMTFTGTQAINREIINYINDYSTDFKQRKAGSSKKKKMKINTGWKLKTEIPIIDSILEAKRIWLFTEDISKRVEAYCISDKLELYNTKNETNDYFLEFVINE